MKISLLALLISSTLFAIEAPLDVLKTGDTVSKELLKKIIPWVVKNILNLWNEITTFTGGSGDTTYDYVLTLVIFVIDGIC